MATDQMSSDGQRTPWQHAFQGSPLNLDKQSGQQLNDFNRYTGQQGQQPSTVSPPLLTSQSGHRYADYAANANPSPGSAGSGAFPASNVSQTSPPFNYTSFNPGQVPHSYSLQQMLHPHQRSTPNSPYSDSYALQSGRPPISVMTSQPPTPSLSPSQNGSTHGDMAASSFSQPLQPQGFNPSAAGNCTLPIAMPIPMLGSNSSSIAYLTASGSGLDPTSMIYDENSGGYATPSYAGSYADDSSFDDRRSHSPFSSHPGSHVPSPYQPQQQNQYHSETSGFLQDANRRLSVIGQGPAYANNANDLLAFRDKLQSHSTDWDDGSSVGGAVERDSVSRSSPANHNYSPDLVGQQHQGVEGHGLEMAVERMFAPLPSPKLFASSIATREDTHRSTSAPPPASQDGPHQPHPGSARSQVFASPAPSPRLGGHQTHSGNHASFEQGNNQPTNVPSLARFSPSPTSPAFRLSGSASPHGQPSLKSPPLPNALQQTSSTENRNASLAPLAIPAKPDLTLTTATPTAIPRTATARQDSTQAALDTVFSTFFQKPSGRQDSKDSTDSMPSTTLAPEATQALYNNIPAHDLTLNLNLGESASNGEQQRRAPPTRQRSKSDTYITSPVNFEGPSFSFAGPDTANAFPKRQQTGPAIDPRALDGSTPGWADFNSSGNAYGLDGSALSTAEDSDAYLSGSRPSEAGPSARRRSVVDAAPYDPFRLDTATPDKQSLLVPPSPGSMRRAGSHTSNHRRGVQSEDYTASTFTPKTAQFAELRTPNIHIPFNEQQQQHQHQPRQLGHDYLQQDPHQHSSQALLPQPSSHFQPNASQYLTPGYDRMSFDSNSLRSDGFVNGQYEGQQYDARGLPPMPPAFGGQQDGFGILPSAGTDYSHQGTSMYQGYLPPGDPYFLGNNTLMPNFPGYTPGPGMSFNPGDMNYGNSDMLYPPLEEDYSLGPDGMPDGTRMRRRSSVRSDVSGVSGLSGVSDFTYESKTTEATKQAARRRRKDPAAAKFCCDYCGETFTRAYNLKGHIRSHEGSKPFVCNVCNKGFARRHDLKRHELLHSGVKKYMCEACQTPFVRLDALQRHHKSESGAACIQQISDMGGSTGVEL